MWALPYLAKMNMTISTDSSMTPTDPVVSLKYKEALKVPAFRKRSAPMMVCPIKKRDTLCS